jgi:hypothetical protein
MSDTQTRPRQFIHWLICTSPENFDIVVELKWIKSRNFQSETRNQMKKNWNQPFRLLESLIFSFSDEFVTRSKNLLIHL